MLEIASEIIQRVVYRYQRGGGLILFFHVCGIFSDNHTHALENMQFISAAAV
ncbi:hypothetical protein D3C72_1019330 [compost metagenome]